MRKTMLAISSCLCLVMAPAASAELLLYEPFDYQAGPLQGQGVSVDGWVGGWWASQYTVSPDSLALPNMPFATAGGHAAGSSTANRDFDEISTASAGTYYLSFLAQRTGFDPASTSGQWLDVHFRDSFTRQFSAGATSAGDFHLGDEGGDDPATTPAGQALSSDVFLYVVKIVVGDAGESDELYLKVYDDGANVSGVEPTSWTLSNSSANFEGDFNKLTLWAGTRTGYSAHVDEIRLATTWREAVPAPIPEPAAMALMGLGSLLALRRQLRR